MPTEPATPPAPGGRWEFCVPKWTPPSLNDGLGAHWSVAHALKKQVAEFLAIYAKLGDVPFVTFDYRPKRRFDMSCVGWGRGESMPDPDNLLKFVLDAATRCRLIVDDSAEWVEWRTPLLQRGTPEITIFTISDLETRPPIDPAADPVVKRFVGRMKAKGKRHGRP